MNVSRRPFTALFLVIGLLTGCSGWETAKPPTNETTNWTYKGQTGPDSWGDLSESYSVCKTGTTQSPIDLPIQPAGDSGRATITGHEQVTVGESSDAGHTDVASPTQTGQTIDYAGTSFTLNRLHFHVPAEHTVAGRRFDAEFHLVHTDPSGKTLVLSMFAEKGHSQPAMQPFIDNATSEFGQATSISLRDILPADSPMLTYSGSLTTPPCTEDVQWIVLREAMTVSPAQFDQLGQLRSGNARPVQPLGARVVRTGEAISLELPE